MYLKSIIIKYYYRDPQLSDKIEEVQKPKPQDKPKLPKKSVVKSQPKNNIHFLKPPQLFENTDNKVINLKNRDRPIDLDFKSYIFPV